MTAWGREADSNRRHRGYEPRALPTALSRVEQVTGIEPAHPAWKAGTLPVELHLHGSGRVAAHPDKEDVDPSRKGTLPESVCKGSEKASGRTRTGVLSGHS